MEMDREGDTGTILKERPSYQRFVLPPMQIGMEHIRDLLLVSISGSRPNDVGQEWDDQWRTDNACNESGNIYWL
jgi:hypothetical protein